MRIDLKKAKFHHVSLVDNGVSSFTTDTADNELKQNLETLKTKIERINEFRNNEHQQRFENRQNAAESPFAKLQLNFHENVMGVMDDFLLSDQKKNTDKFSENLTRYYQKIINSAVDEYNKLAIKESPTDDQKIRLIQVTAIIELRLAWYSKIDPTQPALNLPLVDEAKKNIVARKTDTKWKALFEAENEKMRVLQEPFFKEIGIAVSHYKKSWDDAVKKMTGSSLSIISTSELAYAMDQVLESIEFCTKFQTYLEKNASKNIRDKDGKLLSDVVSQQKESLDKTREQLGNEIGKRLITHFSAIDHDERNIGHLRGIAGVMMHRLGSIEIKDPSFEDQQYNFITGLKPMTIAEIVQSRAEESLSDSYRNIMTATAITPQVSNETPLTVMMRTMRGTTLSEETSKKLNESLSKLPIPLQFDTGAKVFMVIGAKPETAKSESEKIAILEAQYKRHGGETSAWMAISKNQTTYDAVINNMIKRAGSIFHRNGATYKTLYSVQKNKITDEKTPEAEKIAFIRQIYRSHAGWLNRANKIFSAKKTYDEIIKELRSQAKKNPDGASAKTLLDIENIAKQQNANLAEVQDKNSEFNNKVIPQIGELNIALKNTFELREQLENGQLKRDELCNPYWQSFLKNAANLETTFKKLISTCEEGYKTADTEKKRLIDFYKTAINQQKKELEQCRIAIAKKLEQQLMNTLSAAITVTSENKKLLSQAKILSTNLESLSPELSEKCKKNILSEFRRQLLSESEDYFEEEKRPYDLLTVKKNSDIHSIGADTHLKWLMEKCAERLKMLPDGYTSSEHIEFINRLISDPTDQALQQFEDGTLQNIYQQWLDDPKYTADEIFLDDKRKNNAYYDLAKAAEAMNNDAATAREFIKNLSGKNLLEMGDDKHVKIAMCCDNTMSMVDATQVEPTIEKFYRLFENPNGTAPHNHQINPSDLPKMVNYIATHEKPPKEKFKALIAFISTYIKENNMTDNFLTFNGQSVAFDTLRSLVIQSVKMSALNEPEAINLLLEYLEKRIEWIINHDGKWSTQDEDIIGLLKQYAPMEVDKLIERNQDKISANIEKNLPDIIKVLSHGTNQSELLSALFQFRLNNLINSAASEDNSEKIAFIANKWISDLRANAPNTENLVIELVLKLLTPHEDNPHAIDSCMKIILANGTIKQQVDAAIQCPAAYLRNLKPYDDTAFSFSDQKSFIEQIEVISELLKRKNETNSHEKKEIASIYDNLLKHIQSTSIEDQIENELTEWAINIIPTESPEMAVIIYLFCTGSASINLSEDQKIELRQKILDHLITMANLPLLKSFLDIVAEENITNPFQLTNDKIRISRSNSLTSDVNKNEEISISRSNSLASDVNTIAANPNDEFGDFEVTSNPDTEPEAIDTIEATSFNPYEQMLTDWLLSDPKRYGDSPDIKVQLENKLRLGQIAWLEDIANEKVTIKSEANIAWIQSIALNPGDIDTFLNASTDDHERLLATLTQFFERHCYEFKAIQSFSNHIMIFAQSVSDQLGPPQNTQLNEMIQKHKDKIEHAFEIEDAKHELRTIQTANKEEIRTMLFRPTEYWVNRFKIVEDHDKNIFDHFTTHIQNIRTIEPMLINILLTTPKTKLDTVNVPFISKLLGKGRSNHLIQTFKNAHEIADCFISGNINDVIRKYSTLEPSNKSIINDVIQQAFNEQIKDILSKMFEANKNVKYDPKLTILRYELTDKISPKQMNTLKNLLGEVEKNGTSIFSRNVTVEAQAAKTTLAKIIEIEKNLQTFVAATKNNSQHSVPSILNHQPKKPLPEVESSSLLSSAPTRK